jgi:hypothetical protein
VTDLETGDVPEEARAAEVKLARGAESHGGAYGTWTQNRPDPTIAAVARSIARKSQISFARFDEFWLLVSCGTPATRSDCLDAPPESWPTRSAISWRTCSSMPSNADLSGLLRTESDCWRA